MKKVKGVLTNAYVAIFALLVSLTSTSVFAQGVDTSSSSLTALEDWLMTWIPLAATSVLLALFVAWWLHAVRADFMFRSAIALIGIGSASFIVGLFLT